jgi:hypothetical protein
MRWQISFGAALLLIAAVISFLHIIVFKDAYHIYYYLLMDIAFIPIDVLIVTLVLDNILSLREKKSRMKKLNMVIGAFFSEVGTALLRDIVSFDPRPEALKEELSGIKDWNEKRFIRAQKALTDMVNNVDSRRGDISGLKVFLTEKREFLLRLLENPNLLEHTTFTDMLWAVFHLTDELHHRETLNGLPETDYKHITGDIRRAYVTLVFEWLSYMGHLKKDYPYLFSLALRTNPFVHRTSVVVL